MSGSRKRYLAELEQFAAEREQAALEAPFIRFGKSSGLSPGMNRQQTISSLKERSDNAKLETAHGAVGLGGVGLLAARYAPGVKPVARKALEHASLGTAVIGGGIGGAYALRRAATDRKNIAAQRQQLGVNKRAPELGHFLRHQGRHAAIPVAGVGLTSHEVDRKSGDHRQGLGVELGAAGGFGAYQGAGYHLKHTADAKTPATFKAGRKRSDFDTTAEKKQVDAAIRERRDHSAKFPNKTDYHRNTPSHWPGSSERRLVGWTHAGNTGRALGAASIVGGAVLGRQALKNRQVNKHSDETTTLGHDMAHVREDQKAMDLRTKLKNKQEKDDLEFFTRENQKMGIRARKDLRKNKARYVVRGAPSREKKRNFDDLLGTGPFGKRDHNTPLQTTVSEEDAKKLVERHGLTGALPKNLSREQRMAAYEARYVTAGGHKANEWQHRANVGDKVKTGGLAVATAGGAGWLASRGRLKTKIKLKPKFVHHAETLAGAGATIGGAGELYGDYARRKRSSYASAPSGVAASALRRMQGYNA